MIYRKQNRLNEEADILKQAMQAQIDTGNPGMAHHQFSERLKKVEELKLKAKK